MLEIMIVLAMVSILAVLAVPNFQVLLEKNRVTTQVNEFIAALSLARSEAVKRGHRVSVCKSPDGKQCTADGHWDQGWLVYADENEDGELDNEPVLLIREGLSSGTTFVGNAHVDSSIHYRDDGSALQNGVVSLSSHAVGVNVILSRTGRVRTEKASCP
ncbi:MAG: GspH/FimT family pseudopilin [bacterium]